MSEPSLARYQRQIIFAGLGEAGQRRLLASSVVIVGCGAIGSVLANHLARAGVGRLRIVDRDYVELNNLHRQALFDEDDLAARLPKAVAAERHLRKFNSEIEVEGVVADFNPANALELLQGADLALDGTDNFEARYLLNDACLKLGLPWVYTGVVASYGMTATLIPAGAAAKVGRQPTGCLQCLLGPEPPTGGPTCDTVGVLGPIVATLASVSAAEAIKILTGSGELNPGLLHVDLWYNSFETFSWAGPQPDCPACGRGEYRFLNAEIGSRSAVLCGRNAVQVSAAHARLHLPTVAERLAALGRVRQNPYLVIAEIDGYELTVFADGRAIIKGTEDPELARSLYARYVGV
ncbi:MAG: ThiF family adenylyltransferase [Anaerolineae bacterium]|nr:ThiF family adenylyltransferase [Caldilineales bacterium]MDW8267644.1 ThiF family adenylyltransferase [Anaerolineae bacterium]